MTETYMTIREMCDTYEVTPRTLRFYESKELLFPERQGNRRLFTKRDRARLKLILRGKRFGFSLEEIRQLLDLYNPVQNNLPQMLKASDLGKAHLKDLEARRIELDEVIADLKRQLDVGDKLIAAAHLSAAE
ncbi:MAG: MerR family DNA-binding transcriptional regulator [Silicimonas sp.]|nr:MerR family DNA-binding transcriptional regulator [Silicimonas sp.]